MTNKTINWLTHPTGDPFADVGGFDPEESHKMVENVGALRMLNFYLERCISGAAGCSQNRPVSVFRGR